MDQKPQVISQYFIKYRLVRRIRHKEGIALEIAMEAVAGAGGISIAGPHKLAFFYCTI
ncbi:hypothetical protein ACFLWS_01470 [Chloroflexota bacterium]